MTHTPDMKGFNEAVEKWGRNTRSAFLMRLRQLPFKRRKMWKTRKGTEILRERVGMRTKKNYGDIYRVVFPFTRHGIFQEHGVGRGRPIRSNRVKPRPWIEPTFKLTVPTLADVLQDEAIAQLGLQMKIKVNGIFEWHME